MESDHLSEADDTSGRDLIGTGDCDRSIDVVIVNWNAAGHLTACLESLTPDTEQRHIRSITIVDNGSTDGSLEGCIAEGLPAYIDRAETNLGFAAGANRGARRGQAPYVLFLNPDARLLPGALNAALAAFGRVGSAGIVGLRLLDANSNVSRTCSRFPSPYAFIARSLGLDRLPGGHRWSPFMEEWPHTESREVDQVMGACLLLSRQLFVELGGFDERFFMYYEDVDLAKRARQMNRISWFEASGAAYHVGGGSSTSIPGRRLYYILASRLAYGRKHFGYTGFLMVAFATLLLEPWSRLARESWRRSLAGTTAVLAGYGLLVRHLVRRT